MSKLKGHHHYFDLLETVRCPESRQTLIEETFNVLTHRLALLCSVTGLVVMVGLAATFGTAIHVIAVASFCLFLTLLFTASMLYHSADHLPRKKIFRTLDHIAIFFVIAGTYTPFMLAIHEYDIAWPLFFVMWAVAAVGVVLKIYFTGRFQVLSTVLYLGMGWMTALAIGPLYESLSTLGFYLLAAGGISYTVGSLFFLLERMPFNHVLWHLFVMAGATCHYFAVMTLVLPGVA